MHATDLRLVHNMRLIERSVFACVALQPGVHI